MLAVAVAVGGGRRAGARDGVDSASCLGLGPRPGAQLAPRVCRYLSTASLRPSATSRASAAGARPRACATSRRRSPSAGAARLRARTPRASSATPTCCARSSSRRRRWARLAPLATHHTRPDPQPNPPPPPSLFRCAGACGGHRARPRRSRGCRPLLLRDGQAGRRGGHARAGTPDDSRLTAHPT